MKWENRDIIVAKRWNIAKFSKVDNIVAPLRLPKLFFDDVLADIIFGYTKFYSHREKAGISFEITIENVCSLVSMLLVRVCHKLPDCKTYWETTTNTFE